MQNDIKLSEARKLYPAADGLGVSAHIDGGFTVQIMAGGVAYGLITQRGERRIFGTIDAAVNVCREITGGRAMFPINFYFPAHAEPEATN